MLDYKKFTIKKKKLQGSSVSVCCAHVVTTTFSLHVLSHCLFLLVPLSVLLHSVFHQHRYRHRMWKRKQGSTSCQVSAPALSLMISKSFCVSESLKLELLRVETRVLNGSSRGTSATSRAAAASKQSRRSEKTLGFGFKVKTL